MKRCFIIENKNILFGVQIKRTQNTNFKKYWKIYKDRNLIQKTITQHNHIDTSIS